MRGQLLLFCFNIIKCAYPLINTKLGLNLRPWGYPSIPQIDGRQRLFYAWIHWDSGLKSLS